jgi:CubicO group peptidase (beta-lactamase class C family)
MRINLEGTHRVVLTCLGMASLACAIDAHAVEGRGDFQPVERVLAQHIEAGDVPGAVVLLKQDGKTLFWEAKGVGDAKAPAPLTKDSIFWIASLTKPIVASGILMLADEGKLSINDPVSKYLPGYSARRQVRTLKPGSKLPPPAAPGSPATSTNAAAPEYDYVSAKREITLKDLLTHSSGLQSIGIPNPAIPDIVPGDTLAGWVPKLSVTPLDFQPGEGWAYSNAAAFDVLARVVEVASGKPFDEFIQKRLFEPLQMKSTGFRGKRPDLVSREVAVDPRLLANPCIEGTTFICGSAGLWSSVEDYAKFAQMLLDGGKAPNGQRILRRDTVKLLASDAIGNLFPGTQGISGEGAAMGLGVLLIKDPATAGVPVPQGSFGWDGVGTRRFWVIPDKKVVLIMFIPSGKGPLVQRDIEAAALIAIRH